MEGASSFAIPRVKESKAAFEAPLEVGKLCLNEDSSKRHTCAFDKVKDWTIQNAEQTLAEMYGEEFQGDFEDSEKIE